MAKDNLGSIKTAGKAFRRVAKAGRRQELKQAKGWLTRQRQLDAMIARANQQVFDQEVAGFIVPQSIKDAIVNPPSVHDTSKSAQAWRRVVSPANIRQRSYVEVTIPADSIMLNLPDIKAYQEFKIPDKVIQVPWSQRENMDAYIMKAFRRDALQEIKREKADRKAKIAKAKANAKEKGKPYKEPDFDFGAIELLAMFTGSKSGSLPKVDDLLEKYPIEYTPTGSGKMEAMSDLLAMYASPDYNTNINQEARQALIKAHEMEQVSKIAVNPIFGGDKEAASNFFNHVRDNPAWQRFRRRKDDKMWKLYEETREEIISMMLRVPPMVAQAALTYVLDRYTTPEGIVDGFREYLKGHGYQI